MYQQSNVSSIFKAVFSPERKYRYVLKRKWDERQLRINFIGLNPSTADEDNDDATIRKLIGFSQRLGFSEFTIVNLFAHISRDPAGLLEVNSPIGPKNDDWILRMASEAHMNVVMWGNNGHVQNRDKQVLELLKHRQLYCFGVNENKTPRHPLMLSYETTEIEIFRRKIT